MSETEKEAKEEFCEEICEEEREKRGSQKKKKKRRREKRENLKKCVGIGKAKEALGGWEKLKIVNIKKEKRKK